MVAENKLRIYCETSFWSFLNGRRTPLAHIAVKQAATLQWWEEIAPTCEIYISQYVSNEILRGDQERAEMRQASLDATLGIDASIDEVAALARALMDGHAIPASESTDAFHIAAAAVYGMDVLLTWNCRHMANPVTLPKIAKILAAAGYSCPIFITPIEFIERMDELGITPVPNTNAYDPMEEVYAVRRMISAEYGHDIARLAEAAKEWKRRDEATGRRRYVRLPIARVAPARA